MGGQRITDAQAVGKPRRSTSRTRMRKPIGREDRLPTRRPHKMAEGPEEGEANGGLMPINGPR